MSQAMLQFILRPFHQPSSGHGRWFDLRLGMAFVLLVALSLTGCKLLQPKSDDLPEYDEARRAIESYEDSEGNWVRPEGTRAEKRKNSITYKATQWIPGIGEKPVDKEKARTLFRQAETLFTQAKDAEGKERTRLFKEAADKYEESAKYWTSSALEQDAFFMAGESYFFAESYYAAEQRYAKLLKEYPRNRFEDTIDSRRMEIAMYWVRFNQVEPKPFYVVNLMDGKRPWNDTGGHGKKTLENIRLSHPTGPLTDDVTMELANSAFQKAHYQDAADYYSDLRMTYPDSPHQFEAHFLGLKSVLETYQGPDYNDAPLLEAEKLIKQIVRQFPNDYRQHEEYVTKAYKEVRYRKAERLWVQADYRINRQENNSARIYIDQILVEFSDTPFADKAREAQAKIKDLPDDPPERFRWISRWFPDPDPVKPFIHHSE